KKSQSKDQVGHEGSQRVLRSHSIKVKRLVDEINDLAGNKRDKKVAKCLLNVCKGSDLQKHPRKDKSLGESLGKVDYEARMEELTKGNIVLKHNVISLKNFCKFNLEAWEAHHKIASPFHCPRGPKICLASRAKANWRVRKRFKY
ncbi:hypothetical protein KI387_009787, partial [Taxus chinensis]